MFVSCEQKHKTQFCLPRNEHCKALTCWHMCAQNTVSCCYGPPKNHNYSYNCTMSVMSCGVFSKHKTQLAVLINSEMNAAAHCAQNTGGKTQLPVLIYPARMNTATLRCVCMLGGQKTTWQVCQDHILSCIRHNLRRQFRTPACICVRARVHVLFMHIAN